MSVEPNLTHEDLSPVDDRESVQAAVLQAAVTGNQYVRSRLPGLLDAFEEPYRSIAGVVIRLVTDGFLDRQVLEASLGGVRLVRTSPQGIMKLTTDEACNLIFASTLQPGQPEAYLQVLGSMASCKHQEDFTQRSVDLAKDYGHEPAVLLQRIADMVAGSAPARTEHPSELMELIPYMRKLLGRQNGSEFLGLHSGFCHFNNLCNGLDTGLLILAAPPGRGKTTWACQVACQVAEYNAVPVIFVSMEQSKEELRVKSLARFSKLHCRHILRGRLDNNDLFNMEKLLDAATRYGELGRHLTVIEGDANTTIEAIEQIAATKFAGAGASRGLIVVDYLQILPLGPRDATRVTGPRDKVDLHVSELRRLARQLNSPVLAISAENRAGYNAKTLNVFKESGGIEYSADIAMILSKDKTQAAPAGAEYRHLDLNVVKNRNGERGVVKFKFYDKRAEFVETGKEELVEAEEEG